MGLMSSSVSETSPCVQVCLVRCVMHTTAAQWPTRLRLSVTQRGGFFSLWRKKHVVAAFTFRQDGWEKSSSDEWQQVTPCQVVDVERLRQLQDNLSLRIKVWTQQRIGKGVLQRTLGDLVDKMESCCNTLTLEVNYSLSKMQFRWLEQEVPQELNTKTPGVKSDQVTLATCEGTDVSQLALDTDETLTAADKGLAVEYETLNKDEEVVYETYEDGDTESEKQWVTFVNPSSGRTSSLPAHTEAEKADRWRGLGAWTSEDDLLDDQALKIIHGIAARPRRRYRNKNSMFSPHSFAIQENRSISRLSDARHYQPSAQLSHLFPETLSLARVETQPRNLETQPRYNETQLQHIETQPQHIETQPQHTKTQPRRPTHRRAKQRFSIVRGASTLLLLAWGFVLAMVWVMFPKFQAIVHQ